MGTVNSCLICNLKNSYPICKKCAENPFKVERCRQILAEKEDVKTLKEMYRSSMAEIKDSNTRKFWDKKLDKVSLFKDQDGMTKDRIEIALDFISKDAKKILDIGSGYGFLEEHLSKNKNIEIYGNDISSRAIANLKKRFKGNFRVESIYKMQYPNKFFDMVFMLEILEHISPARTFEILSKTKRILKDHGILVISVPTNEGLERMTNNPNRHIRMYTEALIIAELKIVGFQVIKLKTLYAFKNSYKLKKILANILHNRWISNDIIIMAKPL